MYVNSSSLKFSDMFQYCCHNVMLAVDICAVLRVNILPVVNFIVLSQPTVCHRGKGGLYIRTKYKSVER